MGKKLPLLFSFLILLGTLNMGAADNGFIENKGQFVDEFGKVNNRVLYLYNGNGIKIQLRQQGFSYDCFKSEANTSTKQAQQQYLTKNFEENATSSTIGFHRVDIDLIGCNPSSKIIAEEPLNYHLNYYTTNVPEGITYVKNYKRITYKNIYPNIDLVFKLENEVPKYDFVVHPGGDISNILLDYSGTNNLQLKKGNIIVSNTLTNITETIPYSYQEINGKRKSVQVNYYQKGNTVGFKSGRYQKNKTLIIDPTIGIVSRVWGTFFGGSITDYAQAIDVDKNKNIYIAGYTDSPTNIATSGAHQTSGASTLITDKDAFIAKFNQNGICQWATYYGGGGGVATNTDGAESIDVDYDGNSILVTGATNTTNYSSIAAGTVHKLANSGLSDAFLVKFNGNGIRQWGTFFGGLSDDIGMSVKQYETNGDILIAGGTKSNSQIATTGTHRTIFSGLEDGFIARFNTSGQLLWGTYYGGEDEERVCSITLDNNSNSFICGYTKSTNATYISTSGGHQTSFAGGGGTGDGFIAKFNSSGQIIWGTYLGSTGSDQLLNIGSDASGNVVVGGIYSSIPNLSTPNAFRTDPGAGGFIAKFNSSGVENWATYYGGISVGLTGVTGINVHKNGDIFVTGFTYTDESVENGQTIATPGSYQTRWKGGTINGDNFIAAFCPDGRRQWGTYYGGNADEYTFAELVIDTLSTRVIMVSATSTGGAVVQANNIATGGTHQTNNAGGIDGFIANMAYTPTSCFYSNDSIVCQSDSIIYTETTCGSPTSWSWVFNGGTPSTYNGKTPPAIYYNTSGIYTTSLTATNINGSTTHSYTIQVQDLDLASVTNNFGAPHYLCLGGNATLTAGSGAMSTTYSWYPNTYLSSTSSGQVVFSPLTASVSPYNFTVTATSPLCTRQGYVNILVNPTPTVTLSGNTSICTLTTTTISAYGADAYAWSSNLTVGGGLSNSLAIIIPTVQGIWNYSVVGTDISTCADTTFFSITAFSLPTVVASPHYKQMCMGDTTLLSANGNGNNYSWLPSSNINTTSGNIVTFYAPNSTANVEYTVTATDLNYCKATDVVNINVLPALTINITGDQQLCIGEQTILTATAGFDSYNWSPLPALGSTTENLIINPTTTLTYNVTGVSGSCSAIDSILINVNPLPLVSIAASSSIVCIGQQTVLSASGAANYTWSTGDAGNVISVSPSAKTTYSVKGIDGNGCSNQDSVTVDANPLPIVNAGADVTIYIGESARLTATGAVGYLWLPAFSLSCSDCSTPMANPSATTVYTVSGTDTDACVNTDEIMVTVLLGCREPYIPNVFSPNDDGENDILFIEGHGCDFSSFKFSVFDRWGTKLFESHDINQQWNGKYNSKPLNLGVYVYELTYTIRKNGQTKTFKGNVSIVQ